MCVELGHIQASVSVERQHREADVTHPKHHPIGGLDHDLGHAQSLGRELRHPARRAGPQHPGERGACQSKQFAIGCDQERPGGPAHA